MRMFAAPLLRAWSTLPSVLRGALLIVASTLGFAGMHACIRYASENGGLHAFEIAFFRNLFGLLVLVPLFFRNGPAVFRTKRLKLHVFRGSIQVFAMLMFFSAVTMTPLATVSALSFTAPLFATIGAVLILKEKIRARRMTALAIGFIGMLIIVRPGMIEIDLGGLLVIGSSAIWAMAMLIIKDLGRTESSVTITTYMVVVMTPLTLIPALTVWVWPDWEMYLVFTLMGLLGSGAHVAMAQAFKEADATVVLPFDFTRLIWAGVLGFLLFGQMPEIWVWIGGAVIFASTTYIAYREAQVAVHGEKDESKAKDATRG